MDVIDDDSENDSDYMPGAEEEKDEVEHESEKALTGLTKSSRRRVEVIWQEMQEEDRRSVETVMMKSINYLANRSAQSAEVRHANEVILSSIFGKRVGKRLASYQATPEDEYNPEDIKKRALASVQKVQKKQKITETRKFAGQEISVQRTVRQSATEPNVTGGKRKAGSSGLDQVLDTIKGPKLVSTVAKSSMDWDVYKEKEGLEEDLQAAAKEGYLTRKDFLERCDVRTYEVEKGERVTSKATAGPPGK